MKAVVQKDVGGPGVLYLDQVDPPSLADDEVMIRVEAVSVNRADTLQRRGLYPPPAGVSPVLGLECAGRVTQVGRHVSNIAVGDQVTRLSIRVVVSVM